MRAPFFGLRRSDSSASHRPGPAVLRADLHVHSRLSAGRACGSGLVPASAADPVDLYRAARARGLDLVTLTDLDSIEGGLRVRDRYPGASDFFLSVEVVAHHPGIRGDVHVLVYGVSESQHHELQRLKGDLRELVAFLEEQRLASALGPYLAAIPDDGETDRLRPVFRLFRRFEILNGRENASYNALVARLAEESAAERGYGATAGGGGCRARVVGRVATAAHARNRDEFLRALLDGRTWPVATGPSGRAHVAGWRPIPGAVRLLRARSGRGRLAVRVRLARQRLDERDVKTFQDKTRVYAGAGPAARRSSAGAAAEA